MEDWTGVMESGGSVDVMFLDFKKTFDRGPHNELICRLKSGAVLEISLSSFQSFCLLQTCTVDLRAEFPVTLQYKFSCRSPIFLRGDQKKKVFSTFP